MKKPKITKGPWYPIEYGGYLIIQDEDHYGGLNVFDKQHLPLAENNARAACCVHDLIDSLIAAKIELKSYMEIAGVDDYWQKRFLETIELSEQALTKAGCTE